jgi:hypothetical protein
MNRNCIFLKNPWGRLTLWPKIGYDFFSTGRPTGAMPSSIIYYIISNGQSETESFPQAVWRQAGSPCRRDIYHWHDIFFLLSRMNVHGSQKAAMREIGLKGKNGFID